MIFGAQGTNGVQRARFERVGEVAGDATSTKMSVVADTVISVTTPPSVDSAEHSDLEAMARAAVGAQRDGYKTVITKTINTPAEQKGL